MAKRVRTGGLSAEKSEMLVRSNRRKLTEATPPGILV